MADATIIEFVLVPWIESLPACSALGVKVYPWGDAPQATATRPFVLYHRVYGGRLRSLTGPSGVSHPRLQYDVIGRSYLEARRVAAAIREAFEALPPNSGIGGRTVQVGMVNDDTDGAGDDERPHHGDEVSEHRATVDVTVWFNEA